MYRISNSQFNLALMKFKAPPKRKKIDESPATSSSCTPSVSPLEKSDVVSQLIHISTVPETNTSSVFINEVGVNSAVALAQPKQPGSVDPKIHQARNFTVTQAQQDGCKGNYKVFDSPFGNYLVPVIPTRAELGE